MIFKWERKRMPPEFDICHLYRNFYHLHIWGASVPVFHIHLIQHIAAKVVGSCLTIVYSAKNQGDE